MKRTAVVLMPWLLALVLLIGGFGCDGGDDVSDDDASPVDDDDNDDDSSDDDATPGDDDDDTDVSPEIPGFGYTGADAPFAPMTLRSEGGVTIQRLGGGIPGYDGLAIAAPGDGTFVVASVMARTLFLYHYSADGEVTRETVAHFAAVPSLAVGPNGELHVAYQDTWRDVLVYGVAVAEGWSFSDIVARPASTDGREKLSLAVDAAGNAHLAYLSSAAYELWYATNAGGSWVAERLATGTFYDPKIPQIAVDPEGRVHLAYALEEYRAGYGVRTASGWQLELLPEGARVNGVRLALVGDVPNLLIVGPDQLFRRVGEAWEDEAVSLEGLSYRNAMAVDGNGRIVVALRRGELREPWLATRTGPEEWSEKSLPGQGVSRPGLTVDSSRGAGVAFLDFEAKALRLVLEVEETLNTLEIGSDLSVGKIAVDAEGGPLVSFTEDRGGSENPSDGWLAWTGNDDWRFRKLPESGGVSVAAGATGAFHAAYVDPIQERVIYTTNTDGDWETFALPREAGRDAGKDRGGVLSTRLALTSDGEPYVAGLRTTWSMLGGTSKVLFWHGPDWTPERYEFSGVMMDWALDPTGSPRFPVYNEYMNIMTGVEYFQLWFCGPADQGQWRIGSIAMSQYYARGYGADVAIGPAGNAAISYTNTGQGPMLAIGSAAAAGPWERLDLPTSVTSTSQTAVGVTAEVLAVAFSEYRAVHVANVDGNDWVDLIVDRGIDLAHVIDMAVADDGTVHLVYSGNGAVWYATVEPGN
jgi:hypothetical protein